MGFSDMMSSLGTTLKDPLVVKALLQTAGALNGADYQQMQKGWEQGQQSQELIRKQKEDDDARAFAKEVIGLMRDAPEDENGKLQISGKQVMDIASKYPNLNDEQAMKMMGYIKDLRKAAQEYQINEQNMGLAQSREGREQTKFGQETEANEYNKTLRPIQKKVLEKQANAPTEVGGYLFDTSGNQIGTRYEKPDKPDYDWGMDSSGNLIPIQQGVTPPAGTRLVPNATRTNSGLTFANRQGIRNQARKQAKDEWDRMVEKMPNPEAISPGADSQWINDRADQLEDELLSTENTGDNTPILDQGTSQPQLQKTATAPGTGEEGQQGKRRSGSKSWTDYQTKGKQTAVPPQDQGTPEAVPGDQAREQATNVPSVFNGDQQVNPAPADPSTWQDQLANVISAVTTQPVRQAPTGIAGMTGKDYAKAAGSVVDAVQGAIKNAHAKSQKANEIADIEEQIGPGVAQELKELAAKSKVPYEDVLAEYLRRTK